MPNFDYITDDALRQSLQSDWQELQVVHAAKAWKAVHVLAGSVIEAAIIDYLEVAPLPPPHPDLLKLNFGELVKLCKDNRIISARTADLSSVVRDYRNLIHPGKLVRTGEQATEDSASVARHLVQILVGELETAKTRFQGHTAKQLLQKLLNDDTSLAILPHLLDPMSSSERRRLVLVTIPQEYMQILDPMVEDGPPDFDSADLLKRCHRLVLDSADPDTKQQAAQAYVSILKTRSGKYIETYELAFFRGDDLDHVNAADRPIVKTRLMDRLKATPSVDRLATITGLFSFLTEKEAYDLAYQLLQCIANDKPPGISAPASQTLISECVFLAPPLEDKVKECVRLWAKHADEKHLTQVQRRLATVRSSILGEPVFTPDDDIPF